MYFKPRDYAKTTIQRDKDVSHNKITMAMSLTKASWRTGFIFAFAIVSIYGQAFYNAGKLSRRGHTSSTVLELIRQNGGHTRNSHHFCYELLLIQAKKQSFGYFMLFYLFIYLFIFILFYFFFFFFFFFFCCCFSYYYFDRYCTLTRRR